jgi:hypothetical protein
MLLLAGGRRPDGEVQMIVIDLALAFCALGILGSLAAAGNSQRG